jgi:Phosphopantetheine attachment site
MLPERYLLLPSLPLTPNGKIDYKALPPPDTVRPELKTPYEPPGTELECGIAAVWAEILQRDRIGRHDSFLDLGGDSLLAMQATARLRREIGRELNVRNVLLAESLAMLAQIIEQRPRLNGPVGSVDSPVKVKGSLPDGVIRWPLSVYQQGVYFQWRLRRITPIQLPRHTSTPWAIGPCAAGSSLGYAASREPGASCSV